MKRLGLILVLVLGLSACGEVSGSSTSASSESSALDSSSLNQTSCTSSYSYSFSLAELALDSSLPLGEQRNLNCRLSASGIVTRKIGDSFFLQSRFDYQVDQNDYDYDPDLAALDGRTFAIFVKADKHATDYIVVGMNVHARGEWRYHQESGYRLEISEIGDYTWLQFYGAADPEVYQIDYPDTDAVSDIDANILNRPLLLQDVEVVSFSTQDALSVGDGFSVVVEDRSGGRLAIEVPGALNKDEIVVGPSSFGTIGQRLDVLGIVRMDEEGDFVLVLCSPGDLSLITDVAE